jgi:o-succinylbenzoate---CoA ligase
VIVATLLGASPDFAVLLHAVPRAGGVLVPLHPGWTEPELARALGATGASLLVVPDARVPELRGRLSGVGVVPAEELVEGGAVAADPAYRPADVTLDPDTPVALILTSGSTGAPRPIPLTRENLLASAEGVIRRLRLDPADRWLASLAPAHVGGLALMHRASVVGSTLVMPRGAGGFDAGAFLELADAGEITHASLVPVMLLRLLELRGDRPAPRGLRCLLLGGAATPAPLLERALAARWPVALTWGMTEATSQVATAPPDQVRGKPGSVGRPLAGVTVRVRGAGGEEVPRGEVGELLVAGPTVAPLGLPGEWLPTGDLGRFDADGDLWITGRVSDRILSGGVTVEPAEVEAVLLEHPGVAEVAVAGVPDAEWGERVVAWVVPVAGAPRPEPDALAAFSRARLAAPKRPRRWIYLEALPRNANGKVDRRALLVRGDDAAD